MSTETLSEGLGSEMDMKECFQTLEEAAVEIENAYGRDNVVAQRCRKVMRSLYEEASIYKEAVLETRAAEAEERAAVAR